MARILVAEDEPDMLMGLRDNLQFEGYEVLEAADGEEALRLVKQERPDLMLLDIMMPKLDGLQVCKQVREAGFTLPVLMLTAKSQEMDIVRGLEVGADDYITKPFGVRELLARIKVALRRSGITPSMSKIMRIGDAQVGPGHPARSSVRGRPSPWATSRSKSSRCWSKAPSSPSNVTSCWTKSGASVPTPPTAPWTTT